jgi:hypothetical protein
MLLGLPRLINHARQSYSNEPSNRASHEDREVSERDRAAEDLAAI